MPPTVPRILPLAVEASLDSTTWAALALVLTIVGAALSWVAWRRRGVAAGVRGLAWTLLPLAAWLTGTLRLAAEILDDVVRWATHLVFSPVVWAGMVVAVVAVVLWVVSGVMVARGVGVRTTTGRRPRRERRKVTERGRQHPGDDDGLEDMADIEAILKKHGI